MRSDGEAVAINLDIEAVQKPETLTWIDPIHRAASLPGQTSGWSACKFCSPFRSADRPALRHRQNCRRFAKRCLLGEDLGTEPGLRRAHRQRFLRVAVLGTAASGRAAAAVWGRLHNA